MYPNPDRPEAFSAPYGADSNSSRGDGDCEIYVVLCRKSAGVTGSVTTDPTSEREDGMQGEQQGRQWRIMRSIESRNHGVTLP